MAQRRLSVYFENNTLARVGGDTVVADPNAPKPEAVKPRVVEIGPAADAAKSDEAKPAEKP